MEGLVEGRIVHYVMDNGAHRAAIIVKVWNFENGCSNLTVFPDWTNDGLQREGELPGLMWKTSVFPSEDKTPGTWHWIERA